MSKIFDLKDMSKSTYWSPEVEALADSLWLHERKSKLPKHVIIPNTWFSATAINAPPAEPVIIQFPRERYEERELPKLSGRKTTNIAPNLMNRMTPLKFSAIQKVKPDRWFEVSRLYYNHAVDHLSSGVNIKFEALRTLINDKLTKQCPSVSDTPRDIRDESVRDAFIAVMNAKKSCLETGKFCSVAFRTKKDREQSIYIPKKVVTRNKIYPSYLGVLKTKTNSICNKFPKAIHACRMVYKHNIGYILAMPVAFEQEPAEKRGRIAIDPGVRSFMTGYSQKGIVEIGKGCIGRMKRLHKHLDDLISRIPAAHARKKQRMKKAADRMRAKIKNLIKECHWKSAKYLVTNYSMVIIPPFNTPGMAKRKGRKIRKSTVRAMYDWSHGMFRERLLHQAKKHNCSVCIVNESYTSQTCSYCGNLHKKLGGNKNYDCPSCGVQLDRDVNGARGIYLRSLVTVA
jgi:putative transposase